MNQIFLLRNILVLSFTNLDPTLSTSPHRGRGSGPCGGSAPAGCQWSAMFSILHQRYRYRAGVWRGNSQWSIKWIWGKQKGKSSSQSGPRPGVEQQPAGVLTLSGRWAVRPADRNCSPAWVMSWILPNFYFISYIILSPPEATHDTQSNAAIHILSNQSWTSTIWEYFYCLEASMIYRAGYFATTNGENHHLISQFKRRNWQELVTLSRN